MSWTGLWIVDPAQACRPAEGRVATALRSVTPALLFGFRLWAAVCLALYVSFWLELDSPFRGLMQISSEPAHLALALLGQ